MHVSCCTFVLLLDKILKEREGRGGSDRGSWGSYQRTRPQQKYYACPKNLSRNLFIEYPQMWVWPQVPLEGPPLQPPPPPPCTLGPLPPHQIGPPCPGALQKEPRGCGGKREGEGGEGRALAWGKGAPIAMGERGTLQTSVGCQTHIWGLSNL